MPLDDARRPRDRSSLAKEQQCMRRTIVKDLSRLPVSRWVNCRLRRRRGVVGGRDALCWVIFDGRVFALECPDLGDRLVWLEVPLKMWLVVGEAEMTRHMIMLGGTSRCQLSQGSEHHYEQP